MIGILYVLAAFALFIAIVKIVFDFRISKHHGIPKDEFIRIFTDISIPAGIPAAVHDYYKRGVIFKDFGIGPDDSYEYVLGEGKEDIDDDARFLINQLGLKLPSEELRLQWEEQMLAPRRKASDTVNLLPNSTQWAQPIQTVRDMVLWLDWVRQHQDA